MQSNKIRENIIGSRNIRSFLTMTILILAGLGFLLAGASSYLRINTFILTNTSEIKFIPQGITMLFYGALALSLGFYNLFTIFWNIGSGYNEFSKEDQLVRIIRAGFPGKNRVLFFSYEFKNIKKLKFLNKRGLNPRYNILLVLKDKREIPLFPAQFLLNPAEIEKKATQLAIFLKVPLENYAQ